MSCPHLPSVWVELGPIIESSKKCRQVTCQATTNLWICIHPSCGFVACGRTVAGHAENHSKQKKHDICMNISTGVIWCYACDTEVIERERAPNEYKAKLRAFRSLIHSDQPAPTLSSSSASFLSSSAGNGTTTMNNHGTSNGNSVPGSISSSSSSSLSSSSLSSSLYLNSTVPGTPTPTVLLSRTDTDYAPYWSPVYPLGPFGSTNTSSTTITSSSSSSATAVSTVSPSVAGLVGLANLGNTCFLNASLQALSNVSPLALYFTEVPFTSTRPEREQQPQINSSRSSMNDANGTNNGGLSLPLRQLYLALWDTIPRQPTPFGYNAPFYKPGNILNNLRKVNPLFEGYNQQDAHEALRTILNDAHEKCAIDIPIGLYNNNFPAPVYSSPHKPLHSASTSDTSSSSSSSTGLHTNTSVAKDTDSSCNTNNGNSSTNDASSSSSMISDSSILSKRSRKNEGLQLRELRNNTTNTGSSRSLRPSNHTETEIDSDDSLDGTLPVRRSTSTKSVNHSSSSSSSSSTGTTTTTNQNRSWLHDGPYTGPDTVQRSIISDLFQGLFCSRVRCSVCKTESLTYETFWDLSLSIPDRPHPVAAGTDGSTVPPEARQWSAENETDFDDTPVLNHHPYDTLGDMSPLSAAAAALSTNIGSGAYHVDKHGNIVINQEPVVQSMDNMYDDNNVNKAMTGASKAGNGTTKASPTTQGRTNNNGSTINEYTHGNGDAPNTVVVSNAMRKALSTEGDNNNNGNFPTNDHDTSDNGGGIGNRSSSSSSSSSSTWGSVGKVFSSVFCSLRNFLPMSSDSFGHIGRDSTIGMGDCLYNFFEWDPLTKANQYSCEKCKMKVDAERRISIAALPEVLCIHIKRFSYHNWGSKNSTPINYPLTGLDLSPFLSHGAHSQAIKSYIRAKEQQVGRSLIINNSSNSTNGNGTTVNSGGSGSSTTSDHSFTASVGSSVSVHTEAIHDGSSSNGSHPSGNGKKRTVPSPIITGRNKSTKTNPSSSASASASANGSTVSGKKRVISEMSPEARAIVLHRHSLATGTTGMEEITAAITALSTVPLTPSANSNPNNKTDLTVSTNDVVLDTTPVSTTLLSATGIPLPAVLTSPSNRNGTNPNTAMATLATAAVHHHYPLAFWCAYLLPRPAPWLGPLVGPYPVPQVRRVSPASLGDAKYDLVSVVQHLGGIHGGHYIAHAKNRFDNRWYTFDDASVSPIDTNSVTKKEGYILFYQRQRPVSGPLAPVILPPRDNYDTSLIYISRYWWLRYKTLACPGPISNADILCDHGAVKNDLSEKINQLTIVLTSRQYEILVQAYGSSEPPLKEVTLCSECREEAKALTNRRKREQEKITKVDTTSLPSGEEAWYLMSEVWLSRWRHFIRNEGYTDGTGRGILPPGPIDNARLLGKNGQPLPNLQPITHYRGVNANVWNFLYKIYGGGPPLRRKTIDIYSKDINTNEKMDE